jgi:hypothetical protein
MRCMHIRRSLETACGDKQSEKEGAAINCGSLRCVPSMHTPPTGESPERARQREAPRSPCLGGRTTGFFAPTSRYGGPTDLMRLVATPMPGLPKTFFSFHTS